MYPSPGPKTSTSYNGYRRVRRPASEPGGQPSVDSLYGVRCSASVAGEGHDIVPVSRSTHDSACRVSRAPRSAQDGLWVDHRGERNDVGVSSGRRDPVSGLSTRRTSPSTPSSPGWHRRCRGACVSGPSGRHHRPVPNRPADTTSPHRVARIAPSVRPIGYSVS